MVKHEDAAAATAGPDLEAGPTGGECVCSVIPRRAIAYLRCGQIVFAIVQDDLEQPAGLFELGVGEKVWPLSLGVEQGRLIRVPNALDVAVYLATRIVPGAAIALMSPGQIDAFAVFRLIVVEDRVTL